MQEQMTRPDESMDEYWRRRINDVDKNPQSDDPLRSPEAFSAFKRQWHEWKRQNVTSAYLEKNKSIHKSQPASLIKTSLVDKLMDGPLGGLLGLVILPFICLGVGIYASLVCWPLWLFIGIVSLMVAGGMGGYAYTGFMLYCLISLVWGLYGLFTEGGSGHQVDGREPTDLDGF
jgi:hypothetical protein